MNYIGKWRFHSIGVINESGELIYLSAEEYLNSPMPYIDEQMKMQLPMKCVKESKLQVR